MATYKVSVESDGVDNKPGITTGEERATTDVNVNTEATVTTSDGKTTDAKKR